MGMQGNPGPAHDTHYPIRSGLGPIKPYKQMGEKLKFSLQSESGLNISYSIYDILKMIKLGQSIKFLNLMV